MLTGGSDSVVWTSAPTCPYNTVLASLIGLGAPGEKEAALSTRLELRKDWGCSLWVAVQGGGWSLGGWCKETGLFCFRPITAQPHSQAVAAPSLLWPDSTLANGLFLRTQTKVSIGPERAQLSRRSPSHPGTFQKNPSYQHRLSGQCLLRCIYFCLSRLHRPRSGMPSPKQADLVRATYQSIGFTTFSLNVPHLNWYIMIGMV